MKKSVAWLLLIGIYLNFLAPFVRVNAQRTVGKTPNTKQTMNVNIPNGLKFRLSEGEEGAERREKQPAAEAKPLSESETGALVKRMPELKTEPDDRQEFAKRIGTLPAPKTGKVNAVKFPAPEQVGPNATPAAGPLEVVRWAPEGEVSLAPDLSVSFSQPMVAVSSQEQAAETQPVQLSPQVEGKWRWLGTKTLMFDTKARFPMATKFTARVPAGTRSALGGVLAKDVAWTFTTPPPKVVSTWPSNITTRRDVVMFAAFDQEVDPNALLRVARVTAGGRPVTVRLATEAEVAADTSVAYYSKQTMPRRWVAFRAVNADGSTDNALPGATNVIITFPKGTPSAEGPLTTVKDQSFSFNTYGAMKYTGAWCAWQGAPACRPMDAWTLQFSNPIDPATFDKKMITVTPAVEGLNIYPSGTSIMLTGYKKGRTKYTVNFDGAIKDVYGQTIDGQKATATFNVGSAEPGLYSQGGPFVVLDPAAKQTYSIYSTNMPSVKLRIMRVTPQDWEAYRLYMRYQYYDEQKRPKVPGRVVVDKVLNIENRPDEMVETRVDLSAALDGGLGNAIVEIEPTVRRDKYDLSKITVWAQATMIGLDAYVDNEELVAFATDLRTGKPLAGAEVTILPNGTGPKSRTVSENQGSSKSWWEWLTSWGSSEESQPGEVTAVDENGAASETETVAEADSASTPESGILRLPVPAAQAQNAQNVLLVKKGKDVAFLPEQTDNFWGDYGGWFKRGLSDEMKWFVFDDRKLYRPKEEVSIKGYMRYLPGGKLTDLETIGDRAGGSVNWILSDARGNEITKGSAPINAFGAFDFKFKLTDNMNLGQANLRIDTATGNFTTYHQIDVQEFRRPEFEVSAKVDSAGPHVVGGKADLSVEAKYYAGGGLANAEANWSVTATPTSYTPPGRGDYTFGTWTPWWYAGRYNPYGNAGVTQSFKGVTDASGKHRLKVDFESVSPARPYTIAASASVQDVNRQTWSSSTSLLVHPAELYVGIKSARNFVQKGEKIKVDAIVSNIDGALVAGRDVTVTATLKDWVYEGTSWIEKTVDEQSCAVKSLADKATACEFVAKAGGQYRIAAQVMDDRERTNESELTVWVPGGKTPPKRTVEQEEAQIIPSKAEYQAGETAELLVLSPWPGAEGVLTLRRDGLIKTERFTIKEQSATLRVPIDGKYLPNIYVQVDLTGAADRQNDAGEVDPKLPKRPAFASGSINLPVSVASRKLTVAAEPRDKTLEPGGSTKIDVAVTDKNGEPAGNTEVAVVVVDESVLALSGYRIGNPLDVFYTQRGPGVSDYHLRKDILLANPADAKAPPADVAKPVPVNGRAMNVMSEMAAGAAMPTPQPARAMMKKSERSDAMADKMVADDEKNQPNDGAIALRSNFNALAIFAPQVKTDGSGKATVEVKVPDNLTRYRVMAVAVDSSGKRFGNGESSLTARQPLMVRPSAPRFMNFGDKIELPVVVQNQTDNDMTVNVGVRAANATLTAGGGRTVVVKANDRAEVRFPVSAEKAGTARFQVAATSGKWADAAEISLPVWTPATTEAFATYGSTEENGAIVQPVQAPGDVYPQFGGLEVTTSSTQLQELTDAFIYLYRYQFECSEQVASRMISIAALRDVLTAFKSKDMPKKEELDASFARDIETLKGRQRGDGSFGLWSQRRERYEYPFLTIHVAHALALAKAKGYNVPQEMIDRTKPYLKSVESKFDEWHRKSPEVRWTISAYALYVRNLLGDKDAAKAKALLKEATIEKMPFEALGWVLSVLADDKGSVAEVDAIKRFLVNRTTETAATANFVTNYGDGAWLIMYSNRRADGVLLEALIRTRGKQGTAAGVSVEELIPKLVRGLLDHRTKGAWSNTQENVFILLALDKYFEAYEKVTPDFVTKVWLGSAYAGDQTFKGRSADSNLLNIPMSYLTEQGGQANLILDKQGPGRLYYRIGMKYAPKNLNLKPADYGFEVIRKYEAVDDPSDVRQNPDGTWTFKAGARVRVKLTMVAQARRYHVALVDNLPAGLEILNPALATTEQVPSDPNANSGVMEFGSRSFGGSWWWRQYWFEHQNFRDERAEAFASLLWEGVYSYSYVARATTPGQFVVPPAKAEEMYHPETFGRTGTDFVKVE